nr:hypothetical protein [Tanacetum cinerariifolium]
MHQKALKLSNPERLGCNLLSSTMGTIDRMKSVLTQSALDALCERYYILDVLHHELPGRNDRIYNSPNVPWHCDKTLRKDPDPTPAEFDAKMCNYLADNPAPFRMFSEPFLCFVGIIRYYDLDKDCYPTFWVNVDEGGRS